MTLLYSIGLGLGLALIGVLIAFGMYLAFYRFLPWADRALTRMLFSDVEDEHATRWDQRNG